MNERNLGLAGVAEYVGGVKRKGLRTTRKSCQREAADPTCSSVKGQIGQTPRNCGGDGLDLVGGSPAGGDIEAVANQSAGSWTCNAQSDGRLGFGRKRKQATQHQEMNCFQQKIGSCHLIRCSSQIIKRRTISSLKLFIKYILECLLKSFWLIDAVVL